MLFCMLCLLLIQRARLHLQRTAEPVIFSSLVFAQVAGQLHHQHKLVVVLITVRHPRVALIQHVVAVKIQIVLSPNGKKHELCLLLRHRDHDPILLQNFQYLALIGFRRFFSCTSRCLRAVDDLQIDATSRCDIF